FQGLRRLVGSLAAAQRGIQPVGGVDALIRVGRSFYRMAEGLSGRGELTQEVVSQTQVIVRRHVLRIESRGAAQIVACSRKLAQREFAGAALDVEVAILGRNRQCASEGFDRFLVLPNGDLRLRQFEQQVGAFGGGGEVL